MHQLLQQLVYQQVYRRLWIVQVPIAIQHQQNATYTNSESGTCEISGTLSPTVTNSFDACSGGTITIDYAGTDACGNALSAQHVITVSPPAAPTVSLPAGLPATLDCASADSYSTPAECYLYE